MDTDFRKMVGKLILTGAIVYCVLLTILLAASSFVSCQISQTARDIIIIILTWVTTKAGTVVDFLFGSSQGSESKNKFIMEAADASIPSKKP